MTQIVHIYRLTKYLGGERRDLLKSFICPDGEDRASYLAGLAIDTLADDTGQVFDYSITPAETCISEQSVRELVRAM
jgi:hypothetical protein